MWAKELGGRLSSGLQVRSLAGFMFAADPALRFFVSVASKGVRPTVSRLFATLVRRFVSVANKGLREAQCW